LIIAPLNTGSIGDNVGRWDGARLQSISLKDRGGFLLILHGK